MDPNDSIERIVQQMELAFRDLSVHYGKITAQMHEESSRLAGTASDEPVTRRELSEAFGRISEALGSYQAVLFNIAKRIYQDLGVGGQ